MLQWRFERMPTDPKGRTEPGYRQHMFVCGHERPEGASRPSCSRRGSLALMQSIKRAAKEAGLHDVRVQKSGCLDFCEFGTTAVIYPEGIWYTLKGEDAVAAMVQHLQSGTGADHLQMNMDE
ncbi:MAG: (2Fe-2S) ferredoxin domain-containing protein [Candidatus Poseidoniales archaeon]|nr:MAG: (2Fe-2S) ferredoxin domain-containing protein [Candidatus Poseidoniales archaeon]